ncbi:MAG: aspartyl/asparaginyl beta-hydroxylase domain-containing protein [Acidobacteria bacterium]|nr:aspartyl/asparaginyl beta-hydroxylase domain-containing protein [Acidobacteriota bacterium]
MSALTLIPRLSILAALVASATYVHFRGRVRHRFGRQITDHSTFMAPYNAMMYLFSAIPTTPLAELERFPNLRILIDNWETIRDEAIALRDEGEIRAAAKVEDLAFNSFFRYGWKRFYLKWYDDYLPSARARCPKTIALVDQIPEIHAAMFAYLPPGGELRPHRDPFGGSLRYHLGLATPNSDLCRIYVDDQVYSWRDGEAVLFDETYIHSVKNETGAGRVIFFCDVERPLRSRVITAINRFMIRHVVKASQTRNVEGEKVGALNKVFGAVYAINTTTRKLKESHYRLYYAAKYALLAGLAYVVFLAF